MTSYSFNAYSLGGKYFFPPKLGSWFNGTGSILGLRNTTLWPLKPSSKCYIYHQHQISIILTICNNLLFIYICFVRKNQCFKHLTKRRNHKYKNNIFAGLVSNRCHMYLPVSMHLPYETHKHTVQI